MAEWLGRGLQNLLQRFESASDLKNIKNYGSNKTKEKSITIKDKSETQKAIVENQYR